MSQVDRIRNFEVNKVLKLSKGRTPAIKYIIEAFSDDVAQLEAACRYYFPRTYKARVNWSHKLLETLAVSEIRQIFPLIEELGFPDCREVTDKTLTKLLTVYGEVEIGDRVDYQVYRCGERIATTPELLKVVLASNNPTLLNTLVSHQYTLPDEVLNEIYNIPECRENLVRRIFTLPPEICQDMLQHDTLKPYVVWQQKANLTHYKEAVSVITPDQIWRLYHVNREFLAHEELAELLLQRTDELIADERLNENARYAMEKRIANVSGSRE